MEFNNLAETAQMLDANDPLSGFRNNYHIPQHNGADAVYLCGNSLGLQPKTAASAIADQMTQWQQKAVEGWFDGDQPWLSYHEEVAALAAPIVGALPSEVSIMNSLTVNLHLLMVSFYKPTAQRFKIIIEAGAFPSDQYAVESQVKYHGFDVNEAIVEIAPRQGEHCLQTQDILDTIATHGDSVALVLFGGINYYTGQFFNLKAITQQVHAVGAVAGFDLAHAAGNVPVELHQWDVDFACWCSYKYMNSGPGGISGIFVHQKHHTDNTLNRFAGWWGYDQAERFLMQPGFKPAQGAKGWQVSTSPIILLALHKAALMDFEACGGTLALRNKAVQLTAYFEYLIKDVNRQAGVEVFTIITPADSEARGSQLSVICNYQAKKVFDYLTAKGIIGDWREPDVIRLSAVPMYNSFADVHCAYMALVEASKLFVN